MAKGSAFFFFSLLFCLKFPASISLSLSASWPQAARATAEPGFPPSGNYPAKEHEGPSQEGEQKREENQRGAEGGKSNKHAGETATEQSEEGENAREHAGEADVSEETKNEKGCPLVLPGEGQEGEGGGLGNCVQCGNGQQAGEGTAKKGTESQVKGRRLAATPGNAFSLFSDFSVSTRSENSSSPAKSPLPQARRSPVRDNGEAEKLTSSSSASSAVSRSLASSSRRHTAVNDSGLSSRASFSPNNPLRREREREKRTPGSATSSDVSSSPGSSVSSAFSALLPSGQVPRLKQTEASTGGPCRETWYKARSYQGWEILDESKFWFFTYDDPTGGYVNYVGREEAIHKGLVSVTADGRTIVKVDSWNTVKDGDRGRDSVRLSAVEGFDDALWVVSLNHMPEGCGTWPALWTTGADPWPASGEIDLVEGVNSQRKNRISLHTSKGCSMWGIDETNFAGTWAYNGDGAEARDCYVHATEHNTGCSIESIEDAFGEAFNEKGGGVYVVELKRAKHIRAWYFTHQEVPKDLRVGTPDPDSWAETQKLPMAHFPLNDNNCPGRTHFWGHRLVINTTFCGGWAGNLFSRAAGCAGDGHDACRAFVRNNPSSFKKAFWDFNFIHIYVPGAVSCGSTTTSTTTSSPSIGTGSPVYPGPSSSTSTSTAPPSHLTETEWWQALYHFLALMAGYTETNRPPCLETNVDYFGYDLKKYEKFIYTAEQCRLLCLNTDGCFYFSFVQTTASCYLKTVQALLGRVTHQLGVVSGQMRCR
ncbi:1,3(4)-beta-glucanase [Toxoplasma gondii VAND]|uniref:1,3(4)-beta-glucanase n=1 Tax=Toxoplasma gondii VAND TaxID=933077 RepID=A0A086PPL1_TOXGO|nr:1,3(4)-beta-glucanase [Toxoplasma gondii VAND]